MMKKKAALGVIIALVILLVGGCTTWFSTTTAWEQMKKSWESDTKGLHRKVTIVAMDGTPIREYESKKMVVESKEGGGIQLDFEGKRISCSNVSVIVEELDNTELED